MRYSSYVRLLAVLWVSLFVIFSIGFIAVAGPIGFGLALLFGLILAIGFGLSIAWAHRAVTEFHGSPFPGLLGVLGFDIEPDDDGYELESAADPVAEGPSSPDWAASRAWTGLPPSPVSAASLPTGVVCSSCGAITEGRDSVFCRKCGARLPGATGRTGSTPPVE